MSQFFQTILSNSVINAAVVAWFLAQLIKIILKLILEKKLDLRLLISSGGMPSSHSAFIVAGAYSVLEICGYNSPEFAIILIISIVVMYDAAGVRRQAGEHAKILNSIEDLWMGKTDEIRTKALKELLGHTPYEVAAGLILGILVGIVV